MHATTRETAAVVDLVEVPAGAQVDDTAAGDFWTGADQARWALMTPEERRIRCLMALSDSRRRAGSKVGEVDYLGGALVGFRGWTSQGR